MTDLQEFVDTFELLGDWDQRYQYLIELGEQLPPMPAELKSEDNRVKGCMSTVHIHAYPDPEQPGAIQYHGDCDTAVIKGVLALLIQLTSGRSADEINQLDMDEIFEKLQLDEQLSPNRHIGVYALFEMMKSQARDAHRSASATA
ncbi:MAG: Fe-S metabolism protein SufE [Gammaproteobacteria bacterium]|nr:Fe-S metabolism protein SufE [Gammaproteobacteria bacterium]